MNRLLLISIIFVAVSCAPKQNSENVTVTDSLTSTNQGDYTKLGFDLMNTESFDGIKTGLYDSEVIKLLGVADSLSEITMSEVDGMNAQTWYYAGHDVEISFSQGDDKKWMSVSYLLKEKSKQASTRGIGIGSLKEDVKKAYKNEIGEEVGPDQVIAGTVYGGIVFWLEEGKVKNIFVGASAE